MSRLLTVLCLAMLAVLAVGGPPAHAGAAETGHAKVTDSWGPIVVTDFPCFDGKEYSLVGGVTFQGSFVATETFFHSRGIERFWGIAEPVDGIGPTYVERGSADTGTFGGRVVDGGFLLTRNHVNTDKFFAYVDGKLDASQTVLIQQTEHWRGVDTDDDGVPDSFDLDVEISRITCPD